MAVRDPARDYIQRLAQWGIQDALPFWAGHAWDERNGGFFEHLGADGSGVYGDTRRVRVQARQCFVFSRAKTEGWLDRLDLAEAGFDLMRQRAFEVDGRPGWVHTLDDKGAVQDGRRDLYDHAFVILACVSMNQATDDASYLAIAERTLAFMDKDMALDNGGYRDAIGAPEHPRRQNPHMHLFEAFLAYYEQTGDPGMRDRLTGLKRLFDEHFFDRDAVLLREYFEPDWSPCWDDGGRVEPGHLCEWVWLLGEYERLIGGDESATRKALLDSAFQNGLNPATGLLYAAIDSQGGLIDSRSRTWMQTEWVRGAAVHCLARQDRDPMALNIACRGLWERHISPATPGGWVDLIDGHGTILDHRIPMSTAYHLLGAVYEVNRYLAETAR